MYGAAASKADLLEIVLFADTKFEHLRLPRFNHFHRRFYNRRLDATTTDRTRQLTAFAYPQLRSQSARCRTVHANHCGNRHTFTLSAPALYITQNVTHRNPPYTYTLALLHSATALRRAAALRAGRLSSISPKRFPRLIRLSRLFAGKKLSINGNAVFMPIVKGR